MELKKYQYGSSPEHIVELTEDQANSANNLRVTEISEDGYAKIHFDGPGNIEAYSEAAEILNRYIADNGGGIPCNQDWLNDHDILTPV